ncbi:hypothetical protein [Archaeoglobus profundus]|uniref:Major facilitator superfamily (MFS) profile domain-containing protein n=1 Tax=Archaeoglobus profundus (strain DSM 5631 / JCM 9629 / NBRC 100127 / Av18) TaxID=572546 RepID=D2RH41_ARCPA|nr:hypothetical protein [Archaeoglobus profundus]ADB57616.1 hypothetical protein Arcpr_0551 [Archaeoglobus profundus DSM 5631]
MLIEVIVFLLGVIYGFLNPGKEDRWKLFKRALVIGSVIGLILGLTFVFLLLPFGFHPLFPLVAIAGVFWMVILFVILTVYFAVIFIVGTFVGDLLESLRS